MTNAEPYICTSATYDNQTCLIGNFWWAKPTFKLTLPVDNDVMWHMEKKYFRKIYGHQTWQSGN